jgi:Na+-transporting NADH:ubiquinone oxidoreductase subunit NqrB
MEEFNENRPIPVPTISNKEATFIPVWEWGISLRQVLSVISGLVIYYVLLKMVGAVLPINHSFIMIVLCPIVILGFVFAFVKKDDQPLEVYLSDRIEYFLSDKVYAVVDEYGDEVIEADWEDFD